MERQEKHYLWLLGVVLFLRALILLGMVLFSEIALSPDEAQYWAWSQALDWGYYSKPPGIAWQIKLTTLLIGNTELGVRFGAIVIGSLIAASVYWVARASGLSARIGFWGGCLFACSPLGMYLSFVATTDGGSILAVMGAAALMAQGIYPNNLKNWNFGCTKVPGLNDHKRPHIANIGLFMIVQSRELSRQPKSNSSGCLGIRTQRAPLFMGIGGLILIGALYKWTAFIFWIFVLLFYGIRVLMRLKGVHAKELYWKRLLMGIAFSLMALLPTFYWNWTHEWATFKHVARTVSHTSDGNAGSFLGAQVGLLSPLLFGLLFISLLYVWRIRTPNLIWLALFPSTLVLYLLLACFKKIQPNWCAYLYPPGMVLIGWYGCAILKKGKKWLVVSSLAGLMITSIGVTLPSLQQRSLGAILSIPYKCNPFRHTMGWRKLPNILNSIGYDPQEHFLCGDKYQTASVLSFYAPSKERPFREYFFNISHTRKNQFSYWPQMEEQEIGRTGFFVVLENIRGDARLCFEKHYIERLCPYFREVACVGNYPLFVANGDVVKQAIIFKCEGYTGLLPPPVSRY